MGTYAGYWGDMTIPEEGRDEFNQRMLYLLEQGRMMNFEQIQIHGKEITLLTSAPNRLQQSPDTTFSSVVSPYPVFI